VYRRCRDAGTQDEHNENGARRSDEIGVIGKDRQTSVLRGSAGFRIDGGCSAEGSLCSSCLGGT
jgi:hypothetical protein